VNIRDYLVKGYKNAGVGAAGAVINWILLFAITQYMGLWYVYSEIIATFFAWFFNYNMNIILKVIRIEPNKPKAAVAVQASDHEELPHPANSTG
jgi:hypothetical protein